MTRPGHTRITRTALRHTIEAITAHAFGVPLRSVTADLEDDAGRLAAAVTVRLALPDLLGTRQDAGQGSLFDRSRTARAAITAIGQELTGRSIGRVDIRLSGSKPAPAAPGYQERKVA
ncbi:hypothetical protein [Pseudarthrobacter sp. 1C304]|uniref:hypothetical protein n=1 Tax=Pseudarthrobacter sp. 1C304 TaxID=3457438 RepID=UPI003FD5F2D9